MDAPARLRILYLMAVLLMTFDLVTPQEAGNVWFSLNDTTYQNNSLVSLDDIGENDTALICETNFTACCWRPETDSNWFVSGNWSFPNETEVPNVVVNETTDQIWDFYRDRDQSVVRMNRRRGGVDGIYRCEIAVSANITQTIYIGVYSTSTGSPDVTSLTFDVRSTTLTCTSAGGPATTVTWRRDGVVITLNATHQQIKRVVDPVNGTYQTVLTIDRSVGFSGIVGTYNCTVENVRGGSSKTAVVKDAGNVWFSLNDTTYQNNSLVSLEDIGENDTALLCETNFTACCWRPETDSNWFVSGNWFFPNETEVPNVVVNEATDLIWDFYRDRDQSVVRMNRRRGGVEGIYHCEIAVSANITQTIYIGVYNTSTGSPDVTSLTFDVRSTTLTCTSTGGPATTVTWRRDGVVITLNATHQQTKSVVDPVNGTYQTVLTIDRSVGLSCIVGTYNCTVENVRGGSSKTAVVKVKGGRNLLFSLRNTTYQNNSLVNLEDIGTGDEALLCKTDLNFCCNRPYVLGHWSYPNGTRVPNKQSKWNFYRGRGEMVMLMHRIRGGEDGIYHCEIPDAMKVSQTIYIGVYNTSTGSPIVTSLTYKNQPRTLTCTSTGGPATNVNWRRDGVVITPNATHQLTKRVVDAINGTYQTVLTIDPSVGQSDIVGTYNCTVENARGESSDTVDIPPEDGTSASKTDRAITTTETDPVSSSSSTQPSNNVPSDGVTTTSAIIVVTVVILLVTIVVGVVILVVLFRVKTRKQRLEINKLQKTTEQENIEMKLKQKETDIDSNLSVDQPPYAEIQTEAPPQVPSHSEEHLEYLNKNSTLTKYSEVEVEQADIKHAHLAKAPRQVKLSNTLSEDLESSPVYQNSNQHGDPPSTYNIPQGNDIYTEPDTTSSHGIDPDSGIYETVYSEPIQPSLFTDAVETPSDSEDLHPYAPIYSLPLNLSKSKEVALKVFGSNIREIRELGMGQFGKVILAETVGLSAKDLKLSESDDDKSKSMLVAVKKLKSDAPNATKEAFEKEVNFMSRLTDKNVIRILGVCYEDTPFIMMEYMERGDLNQYLQKFKIHSTTDSEPDGLITARSLVHISTQIASAMEYLASHNFVHRDLATRNCLVGPNYLVKISDFGMSRSLYDSHYYRISGRFVLPVRWMASECFYGKFSQKSDVWAFGVVMWEIFTLAKVKPYNDMSDKQVVEDALKGKNRKILAKPDMCLVELYEIMLKCWPHNSERRATFEKLFQLLTSIHID